MFLEVQHLRELLVAFKKGLALEKEGLSLPKASTPSEASIPCSPPGSPTSYGPWTDAHELLVAWEGPQGAPSGRSADESGQPVRALSERAEREAGTGAEGFGTGGASSLESRLAVLVAPRAR